MPQPNRDCGRWSPVVGGGMDADANSFATFAIVQLKPRGGGGRIHLQIVDLPALPSRKRSELERPNVGSHQAPHARANGHQHPANLSLLSFMQNDLECSRTR